MGYAVTGESRLPHNVVVLPPRRWQLAPGIVVEVRPVDDQHSIAVVRELGHRGWRDIWAMSATVRHHSPRFNGSQLEVPTYPSSEIAALVDEWVAELLAARSEVRSFTRG